MDMRSLEHCLSDIMRGVGGEACPPDHLKGKKQKENIFILFYFFTFVTFFSTHCYTKVNGFFLC